MLLKAICEPLKSTKVYTVNCFSENERKANCTEALEGAIVEIKCKSLYETRESSPVFRSHCLAGKWNNTGFPNCVRKCGLKIPSVRPLIANGKIATKGSYAWHVAIYKIKTKQYKRYICGGSLISDRLIITAAHCVTNINNGGISNVTNYVVAVGKSFRQFDDPRDRNIQTSKISTIFIPESYKGFSRNFVGDIAILLSTTVFHLDRRISPVCIYGGSDELFYQHILKDDKNLGYVPGFGYTESGNLSETLKEVAVPYVKFETCSIHLPEEFIEFLISDKFCAGFLNKSTSVCLGDSGGGHVVKNPKDNRFYLFGIVSSSPESQGADACNIQQYALYTKIWEYEEFIRKHYN